MTNSNGTKTTSNNVLTEDDYVVKVPKLRKEGIDGLFQFIIDAFGRSNQLIPEFLIASILARAAAQFESFFVQFGQHKTKLNAHWQILVAPTGEGKGVSETFANDLWMAASKLANIEPAKQMDGLVSGQGLLKEISDIDEDGNERSDKRVLIVEEEYEKVMTVGKSDGNTLSGTLRIVHDGKTVGNMSISNKLTSTGAHVVLLAHVTPKGLHDKTSKVDESNGYINRHIFCYGMRNQTVYRPRPVSVGELEVITQELSDIISWCGIYSAPTQMVVSRCFEDYYDQIIPEIHDVDGDETRKSLLSRAPHKLITFSMLFAIFDCSLTIKERHLRSAHAWIDYWFESIDYLWGLEASRVKSQRAIDDSDSIYSFLLEKKQLGVDFVNASELNQKFKRRIPAKQRRAALDYLQHKNKVNIIRGKNNSCRVQLLPL
ncbi:hypothetical protein [Ferrimonas pelagia]|uniref:DUF3987 domain-containing protein n=1 Tax=Ferrimonas pelagia TaxID=1177826 RepID=A0ABP9FC22_9GAMM